MSLSQLWHHNGSASDMLQDLTPQADEHDLAKPAASTQHQIQSPKIQIQDPRIQIQGPKIQFQGPATQGLQHVGATCANPPVKCLLRGDVLCLPLEKYGRHFWPVHDAQQLPILYTLPTLGKTARVHTSFLHMQALGQL